MILVSRNWGVMVRKKFAPLTWINSLKMACGSPEIILEMRFALPHDAF
jgi:hypothetical protein